MKAYISISFNKRHLLNKELKTIQDVLIRFGIEPFIFVDEYHFSPSQEKEMMQKAISSIDDCDLLIAETSYKAIGVGIEAGYAKAKNKLLFYIRHQSAEHSTTLSGISDHNIIYDNTSHLAEKLNFLLTTSLKSFISNK